jgi:hypothetical protein
MQELREDFRLYVAQGPCFEYSSIISSRHDIEWIISQLPEKPKTIALLFSSSIHGWKFSDFVAQVEGSRSDIIGFLKSTNGKTAGAYLTVKERDKEFYFSLQKKIKINNKEALIDLLKDVGGCTICGFNEAEKKGMINTDDYNCDCGNFSKEEIEEYFKVPVDDVSNSILTGDDQSN